jgi:hypothetical protein
LCRVKNKAEEKKEEEAEWCWHIIVDKKEERRVLCKKK